MDVFDAIVFDDEIETPVQVSTQAKPVKGVAVPVKNIVLRIHVDHLGVAIAMQGVGLECVQIEDARGCCYAGLPLLWVFFFNGALLPAHREVSTHNAKRGVVFDDGMRPCIGGSIQDINIPIVGAVVVS